MYAATSKCGGFFLGMDSHTRYDHPATTPGDRRVALGLRPVPRAVWHIAASRGGGMRGAIWAQRRRAKDDNAVGNGLLAAECRPDPWEGYQYRRMGATPRGTCRHRLRTGRPPHFRRADGMGEP